MSTKVKDALFELISSLTKSEKRYFKLLSSRHTIGDENNYVKLFDFIDKQESYDEEEIFREFKGQAFLHRFSITKKRLYDHVLSALDAFHSGSSVDAQIYQWMHTSDILYHKSLYDQCHRILRSAEKMAIKHEKYALLGEIRKKQKRLIENNAYAEYSLEDIREIERTDEMVLGHVRLYNKLWGVKSELFFHLGRKGIARSEEACSQFAEILAKLPANLDTSQMPFDSAYLYNHIYSAYWFATGNHERSYTYLKANLETFNERTGSIQANLNSYFSLLTNAIYVSEKLGYYKDANAYLKDLKSISNRFDTSQHEDMQIKLFASSVSIELSLLTHRGEYASAEQFIPTVERGLELFGPKISPVRNAYIKFKLASIYLATGNYSMALKWINTILNDTDLDDGEDIRSFTHILDLLVHLEMKHDQLMPYALKSTQRFLKSRNRLYSFEKVFLHFLSKRIKCTNEVDAEVLWSELYDHLRAIKEDAFEGIALEYFDFMTWAESKFKKRSFVDLIKDQFTAEFKKAS